MNTFFSTLLISLASTISLAAPIASPTAAPNLAITPGVLCTTSDPDYRGLDYPEQIARCNRNIPTIEKMKVAALYGNIPQADWPQYEFDHLLPLCAGGSDDMRNLWPQPIAQAHEKDKLEVEICTAMKAGTMTQAIAVQKVYDWFQGVTSVPADSLAVLAAPSADPQKVTCTSAQSPTLVARFSVIDNAKLNAISLSLNDSGDHEVISASGSTSGSGSRAKLPPLAGLLRYSIVNPGGRDRFELYVPSTIASVRQPSFVAYVKISFEGTYPNLTALTCGYDAP